MNQPRRLLQALSRFEPFSGPLKPHFACGDLDKAACMRAHLNLMHLAHHWTAFVPA